MGWSTSTSRSNDILLAVDGSAEAEAAIRWAAREAVLRHAPVTLIHVVAPVVVSWPVAPLQACIAEWQQDNACQIIDHSRKTLCAGAGEAEPPAVESHVYYGDVIETLVDATKDALMVVVGSRGMGLLGRRLLGSVSTGLIHHAHCPVAIVHADQAKATDPASPVLLGIDGSAASEGATALAFDEASRRGVDLVALHAWSDVGVFPSLGVDWHKYEEQGREILGERLAGWHEEYPDVRVRRRVVCDGPARWLVDESGQSQLVVVGSHGRGGFARRLLGSVSSAVAQAAKAPVIVVRD